jgi:MFS family permease
MDKTLKTLALSDFFIVSGFGLIAPIFAIFIKDNLIGGSIFFAGLATTVFLVTRSVLQLILSYEFQPKDRLWLLRLGTAIIALVPFIYIFSTKVWHIFFAQFTYAVGASCAYPAWYSLFSSHSEKGKKGFQWAVYNSTVCLGTAATAFIGAWIAQKTNFHIVFLLTGIMAITGFLILSLLERSALKKT